MSGVMSAYAFPVGSVFPSGIDDTAALTQSWPPPCERRPKLLDNYFVLFRFESFVNWTAKYDRTSHRGRVPPSSRPIGDLAADESRSKPRPGRAGSRRQSSEPTVPSGIPIVAAYSSVRPTRQ